MKPLGVHSSGSVSVDQSSSSNSLAMSCGRISAETTTCESQQEERPAQNIGSRPKRACRIMNVIEAAYINSKVLPEGVRLKAESASGQDSGIEEGSTIECTTSVA